MLRYTCHALFLGSLVLLSGCDNSSSSSTSGSPGSPGNPGNPGTPGSPDPQDVVVRLPDVAVPGEAVQASARQAVIHLSISPASPAARRPTMRRKNLYLWNNETCDALSAPVADWNDVSTTPTGSDKYGPYWVIPLTKESGCINVIVRDGTNKLIDSDLRVSFSDFTDRTVSVIAGNSAVYDSRADAFRAAFGVALADAHWVDKTTLLWPGGENKPIVRLYYSHSSKVAADSNGEFSDKYVKLTPTTVNQQVSMRFPHLASYPAFKLPDDVNVDELLQGETVAIAAESDGILSSATQVQTAGVLDDTYAAAAEALSYGAQLTDSGVTFRVWAPTAQQVELVIYSADKKVIASHPMTRDSASGAWSWQGGSDLKGAFYRYAMTVYHPQSRKVEQYEVTDPYAHSLSTNSEYSQVVDLNDSALKPEGWDGLTMPHAQKTKADLAKMTIHESHIRDLSAWDQTVPAELRGKYLALTAQESNMVQHLKQLSASGVTHIELLPVFDLATVNEFNDKVADIQQPFSRLCEVNSAVKSSEFAGYCDSGSTVEEVLTQLKQNDSKDNPQVQALNTLVAQTDSYNWATIRSTIRYRKDPTPPIRKAQRVLKSSAP